MQSIKLLRIIYTKKLTEKSLTIKAVLNSTSALLEFGTRMLINLLLNPILLTGLGDYLYGVWQVLSRTMAYITVASPHQPVQALKIIISNRQSSEDYAEKQRSIGSAIIVWLLFLPIFILVGGFLIWLFPYALETPNGLIKNIRIACFILIVNLCLTPLVTLPYAVLRGQNLGYKRIGFSILILLIGGGASALAIYLGAGIIGLTIATVFAGLITGVMYYLLVKTYVPWFGVRKPSRPEVKAFISLNGWLSLWGLIMSLMLSGDVVFLGLVESPELVTSYSLTKFLTIMVTNSIMMVVGSILPGLGGIAGANHTKKVAIIRKDMILFIWLVGVVVGTTILAWNRAFVTLWVGSTYFSGTIVSSLMVLMVLQLAYIRLDANIIDLTLNVRTKTLLGLFSTGIALLLSWIFMHDLQMGIAGLCIGFILGRMILSLGYPLIVGNFLGTKLMDDIQGMLRPIMVFVFLTILVIGFRNYFIAGTWSSLIFRGFITFSIVGIIAFWAGIPKSDRSRILQQYILRFLK